MDANLVVLCGVLATEPDVRTFESGSTLLRLLVTVRSEAPRRRVDVVPVVLWDPPSELCEGALVARTRVWVVAMVQRRFWQSSEGRRSRVELVARSIQIEDAELAP